MNEPFCMSSFAPFTNVSRWHLPKAGEYAEYKQNLIPKQHLLRYKAFILPCCLLSELLPAQCAADKYQHFDGSGFSGGWLEPERQEERSVRSVKRWGWEERPIMCLKFQGKPSQETGGSTWFQQSELPTTAGRPDANSKLLCGAVGFHLYFNFIQFSNFLRQAHNTFAVEKASFHFKIRNISFPRLV